MRVIAGGTWEFTNNWDCGDNDIESLPATAWGIEGSVKARMYCANRCLNLPDCVSFNYPNLNLSNYLQKTNVVGGLRCYLKHTNRRSRTDGRQWNCGSPHANYQYYTLIDKKARWLGRVMLQQKYFKNHIKLHKKIVINKYNYFSNKLLIPATDYRLDSSLIPRPFDGNCLSNNVYRERFGTCGCDIHCSWDLCRSLSPPSDCLLNTESEWKFDSVKDALVAQLLESM